MAASEAWRGGSAIDPFRSEPIHSVLAGRDGRSGALPVPAADLGEQVVAGQVEVERGHGDVALTEAGDVGLGAFQVLEWLVG